MWPTRATVVAKFSEFLLAQGTVQKALPVVDHRTQRSDFPQAVVVARQVGAGTAPRPLACMVREFRPHGIQLDVPSRCQQMRFIHDQRSETSLPRLDHDRFSATMPLEHVQQPRTHAADFQDGEKPALRPGFLGKIGKEGGTCCCVNSAIKSSGSRIWKFRFDPVARSLR